MAHKFFKAFFFFAHITFLRPALLFIEVKQEFDNLLLKHPTCVPSTASHDLFLFPYNLDSLLSLSLSVFSPLLSLSLSVFFYFSSSSYS